ncbi:MAG: glycosyltransferase family 4 protein [Verrucomicrobiota bacterium]
MPSKPQIIFALPEWLPQLGGLATFYLHLARCRSELGVKTTILTTQKEAHDPGIAGVTVVKLADLRYAHFVRLSQWLPEGWEMAAMALASGAALRDWLVDHERRNAVVFAAEFTGYASMLVAPELPPLVVTAHGALGQIAEHSPGSLLTPDAELLRSLEADALLRADLATAYSPMNKAEWQKRLQREITFIDPPFYTYSKPDTPAKKQRDLLEGIVVGRLQDWKGALVLAEALESLNDNERARLQIHWYGKDTETAPDGSGSLATYLEAHFPRCWSSSFMVEGPVARESVTQKQAEADFALTPSTWDTLNYTVLEAMQRGTPVVVSSGAGASYLIKHDVNGLTFPVNDTGALAETLRQLIKGRVDLTQLGTQAQADLSERFSPSACVQRYEDAAQEALAARKSGRDHVLGSGMGALLLPLINELMEPGNLPQRSARELLGALRQKASQRLGIDL